MCVYLLCWCPHEQILFLCVFISVCKRPHKPQIQCVVFMCVNGPIINDSCVCVCVYVCVSVPDEGLASEDRSAPPSPEDRDGGLFLLKKDSERRAILYKVLNEDQDKVMSNLLENHIQV